MESENRARNLGGSAIVAAMVSGVAAMILAFMSTASGRFEAAAISLLAAAVAFVGVGHAIFRR